MSAQSAARLGDEQSLVSQSASVMTLAGIALIATATVLMLQSMRVFVSYLVFVVDQSNRTSLGGIAVGVFLLSGVAWVAIRLTGLREILVGSTILLAITRIALQYWEAPEARLWLGAAIIVCWGWLAFTLLVTRRELVALGIGLGLAMDLGVRVAFRTVDTPWMPGFAAYLVTWSLVACMLAALFQFQIPRMQHGATRSSAIALLAIGPAFVIFNLMTGNLGLAQSHLGLDFPGASVVLSFGMAIGILGAAIRCSGEIAILSIVRWWLAWRAMLIAVTVGGFWLFWSGPHFGTLGLILATASSIILFAEVMLDGRDGEAEGSTVWSAVCFAGGLLLEVGLLFGYYTYSGSPAFMAGAIGVFLLAVVIGTPRSVTRPRERGVPVVVVAGVIGGLLILIAGWQVWSWTDAAATTTIGPDLTIMTYNIQSGFSVDNHFDLEQTAQVIAAQQPDIVVLQEVSRGWMVTSGVDEVLWLSQQLNMNYAFGANSDDGMWGNVVLSRAPINSVEKVQYDVTENLKRSVLQVEVTTQNGSVWVLATHLDDPSDADQIRLEQADELITAWNHQIPALLMGDMNSDPTDDVVTAFQSAGFVDFGRSLATGGATSEDNRRIDYIFGTRDVLLESIQVPQIWTSDHRPVVAHVSILPASADSIDDSVATAARTEIVDRSNGRWILR